MRCPNCDYDTPALSRCARCNAPLFPQSPSEPSTPGAHEEFSAHDPGRDVGAYSSGTGGRYWEPAQEWQPDDEPAQRLAAEPEPWRTAPPPRKSRNSLIIAVVTGVVLGGIVAGLVLFWPDGNRSGATPASSTSPAASSDSSFAGSRDQATAVNELLDEMSASRTELAPAMTDASRCDGIDAAIDQLDRVRKQREAQLEKVRELKVDTLPDGTELRKTLTQAAVFSLDADKAFLTWAKANQGCTAAKTPLDADFKHGVALSADQATPAKNAFVEMWNPVAEKHGLPARSADKF
jgi:hypothetical protein